MAFPRIVELLALLGGDVLGEEIVDLRLDRARLVADAVVARKGSDVVLVTVPAEARIAEENLASTPIAEIDLAGLPTTVLASGDAALATFAAGIEEW